MEEEDWTCTPTVEGILDQFVKKSFAQQGKTRNGYR